MTPDPKFTWMVDWTLITVTGNAMPPRDPNDNDDEDEEDEEDENQNDEPAVIREPAEDQKCCSRLIERLVLVRLSPIFPLAPLFAS